MAVEATLGAVLAGAALGLSLAAPPGPVNALILREASAGRPWQGVRIGLGATTADFAYLLLAVAGTLALLLDRPRLLAGLSLVGAGLLLSFAWGAWRSARAVQAPALGAPATFAAGFLAAATSPFNLAWWLSTGTVLIAQVGLPLFVGMFAAIVAWVVALSHAVAALGRRVRRLQEGMAYLSAVLLLAFALWIGWRGLALLGVA